MFSRKILVALVLTLVVAILMTACSSTASPATSTAAKPASPTQVQFATAAPPPPSATPQYGGILRRHASAGPATPIGYPPEAVATATNVVNQTCLERLLVEMGDGTILPWLATGYQVAPDKKSITLTLRKGVKFHDGSDFNADAVKFNLDAYIAAKNSKAVAWTSIDVVDDYTVRVNLKQYQNDAVPTIGGTLMISPTAFQKNGIEWTRWNPVGTGPFKFVSFARDVSLKFEKFNDYWQKGKPFLDGIDFTFIADILTAQMAFKAGQLETFDAQGAKMSYDMKNEGYTCITQFPTTAGALTMVPDSGNLDSPLSNKLIRQAVEYAIDRESICSNLSYGFATPTYQVAPREATIAHIPDLPARKYDIAKAKQLLTDAGYPNGFQTKITSDPMTTNKDIMIAIQSSLTKAGIQASLEFPQSAAYIDFRNKGWKNGFLCGLISNYATYTTYYSYAWSGSQFPSMKFPEGFQVMVKDALTTENLDKDKIQKINRLIYDESMIIPVYVQLGSTFVTKGLHDTGFGTAHVSYWSPSTAWLEKGVPLK